GFSHRGSPLLTHDSAAETADGTRTGRRADAGRSTWSREHRAAKILFEAIRDVIPELDHLMSRAALRIDFHHGPAVDHRGREIGAVVDRHRSDGAMLRKRHRGFVGDLGLRGCGIDDEDERLAGTVAE